MKRFVLAIALTGLVSVPVLAGNIPTNGAPAPEPEPTPTTTTTTTTTAQSATASTTLANVVLMIITLIGR